VHAELAEQGQHHVAWPDLIVAAVAERHQVTVLHYNPAFALIAKVTGQHVEWVIPEELREIQAFGQTKLAEQGYSSAFHDLVVSCRVLTAKSASDLGEYGLRIPNTTHVERHFSRERLYRMVQRFDCHR